MGPSRDGLVLGYALWLVAAAGANAQAAAHGGGYSITFGGRWTMAGTRAPILDPSNPEIAKLGGGMTIFSWLRFDDLDRTDNQIHLNLQYEGNDASFTPFAGVKGGWMFGQEGPPVVRGLGAEALNWHQYTMSWQKEGGVLRQYVDGVLVHEAFQQGEDFEFLENKARLSLGGMCYLGTYDGEHWLQNEPTQCNVAYGFSGGIDDLAVVAGALSAEEIALRWNSSLTERRLAGLEPDMVLLYNFNHPTEHEGYEPNLGSAGSDYDFVFGRLPAQSEYAGSRFRPFTVSGDALEFQPPVRTPNPDPSGRAVPKPPDPAAPTVLTARAGEALTLVAPDGARRSIVAPASWSPDAPDASGTLVVELAPADAGGSNTTFHVVPRLAPRGPPDGVRPFFTTGNTVEDRPLVIRLLSAASPNGAPLGANVTTVPTRGALYALPYASSTLAEGTLITHAGCLIPGPQPVVMYVPEPNGAGFPLDTLAYSVVDEADATLESAPTVVPINVEGLDDAPVVSVPSLSLVEDAHAGGVLVSLNASDQEVGTPLDVFITQLPTKGTLFRLPDNVPITNPYSAFEIGEVVTQYVDEVVEVSSFWGNPPYAGYHPMHVIGPPDCSSFGECESEAAWREDVALPVPLGTKVLHPAGDGLIGRVLEVDEADPTRVHIEYHPMYRRNATSDEWYQCHMDPLGPKSYPGRCLRELAPADGGAVRAWVPRDSISPSVGNVWCPLNRALVDDVDLTGGGAFGPQYRYSHNPSHTYAAGGYSEFIVVRFAQPVYVVVVEIGSSRGMGGIVGVRAQAEDGEWVELYSGAAMRDVADEYTRTDRYWRWAPPRTCRPHFTADTLRIEIDTSSQTGVSDWNYIDYIKLVGARELQPASLYSGELRVRYVPHAHAHGTDSFAVVASDCPGDAFSESSEKHVAVRIDERNDAPTAESVVIDGVISEEMETALVVYDVDEADTASDLVVRISHMPSFGTLRDGLGRTVRAVGHELPPDARSLSFVAASIDGATETALNAFNRTIGIALVGYTVTDLAGLVAEATVIFRVLDPTEPQAVLCEAGEELRSGHCRPCADGYVAGSAGINRCEACPAGSYAYDRRTCPPCDSTEYQDEEAQLECRACPANSAYLEASGVPHLPFVTLRGATARSNCTCEEGFYAPEWAARGSECLPCPVGAVCEGTGFSDVVVPTPVKGYFERAATRHVMLRCASTLACPGGGLELCGDGFTGDVCSDCVQGHFSWHGGCYPCETQNRITAAIVVVVFVLALFAIHTTANLERENDKGGLLMSSTVSAAAEIQGVIFFSQMLNLMLETSVAWPESVREFLAAFSIANIDLSVFAPECQYESIGFVRRWQLQCTMPFIFMAAYAAHVLLSAWPRALYALRHKPWAERFRRCRLIVYRAVNAVVLTMSLLYIHTARIALAGLPIACTRQPDGSRTMVGYPAIDCDGEEFRERVLPVAATTSALVVAAYPIVLALFFFFAADVKSSDAWRRCTMIVRIPYKRRWYFWECVDLLRKLLVGVVLAFAGPLGAGTQVAMISLIVLLALVLQMAARPFKHVLVNSLSIYLLFVLLIILVIGGTVYNNPTGVAPAVRTVFDVLVYTSVGSVLILAAVHLMHVFYVYVRSRDLGVISHSLLEMLPSPMRLAVSERMSVHDVSGSPRELNRVSAFLSPTRTGGRANRRSFTTHQVRLTPSMVSGIRKMLEATDPEELIHAITDQMDDEDLQRGLNDALSSLFVLASTTDSFRESEDGRRFAQMTFPEGLDTNSLPHLLHRLNARSRLAVVHELADLFINAGVEDSLEDAHSRAVRADALARALNNLNLAENGSFRTRMNLRRGSAGAAVHPSTRSRSGSFDHGLPRIASDAEIVAALGSITAPASRKGSLLERGGVRARDMAGVDEAGTSGEASPRRTVAPAVSPACSSRKTSNNATPSLVVRALGTAGLGLSGRQPSADVAAAEAAVHPMLAEGQESPLPLRPSAANAAVAEPTAAWMMADAAGAPAAPHGDHAVAAAGPPAPVNDNDADAVVNVG